MWGKLQVLGFLGWGLYVPRDTERIRKDSWWRRRREFGTQGLGKDEASTWSSWFMKLQLVTTWTDRYWVAFSEINATLQSCDGKASISGRKVQKHSTEVVRSLKYQEELYACWVDTNNSGKAYTSSFSFVCFCIFVPSLKEKHPLVQFTGFNYLGM